MKKILYGLIGLSLWFCSVISSEASVSVSIGLPNVSIGINLPLFPELVPLPGYPVYYAPRVDANYFFYDGMYWVYQDDNWYASSWYNGPWGFVDPEVVPLYILRIPVRYYRQPPVYFRGWPSNAPPRWNQHWGRDWEQRREGWDRWKRGSAPPRAPLPVYQRQYSGDRYPRVEHQHTLRSQRYRYQPRDRAVRQYFEKRVDRREGEIHQRGGEDYRRSVPSQSAPQQREPEFREQRQRGGEQREPEFREQRQQGGEQREQQVPRARGQEQRSQDNEKSQEHGRGRGDRENENRGRGRD